MASQPPEMRVAGPCVQGFRDSCGQGSSETHWLSSRDLMQQLNSLAGGRCTFPLCSRDLPSLKSDSAQFTSVAVASDLLLLVFPPQNLML